MNRRRVWTLMAKELREFRSNAAVVLPVAILTVICLAIPLLILVVVPGITGESITSDRTLRQVVARASARLPELASLPLQASIEAFFFQQFLLLFQMVPITGAVSIAAYSVVGEKQGRTLEPLLTT